MNIYIIGNSEDTRTRLIDYVTKKTKEGNVCYFYLFADYSDPTGYKAMMDNLSAMRVADEVHVFWDQHSQDCHFALGMAVALDKPLVLIERDHSVDISQPSYQRAIVEIIKSYKEAYKTGPGDIIFKIPSKRMVFTNDKNQKLLTLSDNGGITFYPEYNPAEATVSFWNMVSGNNPLYYKLIAMQDSLNKIKGVLAWLHDKYTKLWHLYESIRGDSDIEAERILKVDLDMRTQHSSTD